MMAILLGAFGWLKSALSAAFALVVKYPTIAAIIALVCMSAWLWHGWNGAAEERDIARAQTAEIIKASEEATRLAVAARAETEKRYKDLANATDKEHEAALADARDATDAFIAANRVRAKVCPGQAIAAAQGGSASVPAEVSTGIIVGESDVRACGDLYSYAVGAHNWAAGLGEAAR